MRGGLLLGAGVVLLLAVACGEDKTQYSYTKSVGCLKGVGKTETSGRGQTAVRVTTNDSKTFDLLFLPNGQPAKNYAKRLNVTNGILHTKGNVIVYGHQTGNGPDVTTDDMDEVENCLG